MIRNSVCLVVEIQLRNKEEELNSIIQDLRMNYASLQEKFEQEECNKLVSGGSVSLF